MRTCYPTFQLLNHRTLCNQCSFFYRRISTPLSPSPHLSTSNPPSLSSTMPPTTEDKLAAKAVEIYHRIATLQNLRPADSAATNYGDWKREFTEALVSKTIRLWKGEFTNTMVHRKWATIWSLNVRMPLSWSRSPFWCWADGANGPVPSTMKQK